MQNRLSSWQIAGFLFTSVAGTLLHFLFDWTGGNPVAGLFSAVNESIWEHMKLLFYPMVIFAAVESRFAKPLPDSFWWIKLTGILAGLGLIPVLYYCYTGILGVEADWFNITIFFIAAAVSFRMETALFRKRVRCPLPSGVAVGCLAAISLLFSLLTFFPPEIPFFRDPVTGSYGYREQL